MKIYLQRTSVYPNQLYQWKAQALENLANLFEDERKGEQLSARSGIAAARSPGTVL